NFRNQPLRDPRQPFVARLTLVLGLFVGATAASVGQAALADSGELAAAQAAAISTPETAAETAEAAPALLTRPQVYNQVCIACHSPPGIGGAPALGDGAAWAERLAQGHDTLIDHALHGFSGSKGIMPGKGGRLDLSDEEIIEAVQYMVEQAVAQ